VQVVKSLHFGSLPRVSSTQRARGGIRGRRGNGGAVMLQQGRQLKMTSFGDGNLRANNKWQMESMSSIIPGQDMPSNTECLATGNDADVMSENPAIFVDIKPRRGRPPKMRAPFDGKVENVETQNMTGFSYGKITQTNYVCNLCGAVYKHHCNLLTHQVNAHGREKQKNRGRRPLQPPAIESGSSDIFNQT
jgi:hypothetical protein